MWKEERTHTGARRDERTTAGWGGSPRPWALVALRVLLILALGLGTLTACGDVATYEDAPAETVAE